MSVGLGGFGGGGILVPPSSPYAPGAFGAGETPFGFSIPQGNPSAIAGAARVVKALGVSWREQETVLRAAATIALQTDGGWRGQAAGAYAQYSGHVQNILSGNAGACETAAGALTELSEALAQAQSATHKALTDCTEYHAEMVTQQGIADSRASDAATAQVNADSALHPAVKASYAHAAAQAAGEANAANNAAHTAQTQFQTAQKAGQHADEAYQQTMRGVTGRLESAAGDVRQAPQLTGSPAVPITVTQGDATLANVMLMSAGGLPGMASAIRDPGLLNGLACDLPVTPAVALEFIQGFAGAEHTAQIAADDKPLQGGLTAVVPGLKAVEDSPPGQFVAGVVDTTKGAVEFVVHPGDWASAANTLLSTNPFYRQIAYGENPVVAQQNATQTSDNLLKASVDYQDVSHGNYAKALGEVFPLDLKAASELRDAWKASVAARPEVTNVAGQFAGQLVPHADQAAQVVAPLTAYSPSDLSAAAKVAPQQLSQGSVRTLGDIVNGLPGAKPIVLPSPVTKLMQQLPQDPKIIVTQAAEATSTNPVVRRLHHHHG